MNDDNTFRTRASNWANHPYFGSRRVEGLHHRYFGTPLSISPGDPLKRPTNIRLLRLLPSYGSRFGVDNRPVKVLLIETSIEEAPDYYALSYTWGDGRKTATITCDGKQLPVTRNLERALASIRDGNAHEASNPLPGLYVWADGLCINQPDMEEKRTQLLLMPQIYRNASRAIVFLSELAVSQESRPLTKALDHIGDIARMERAIHEGVYEKPGKLDRDHHGHTAWYGALTHPGVFDDPRRAVGWEALHYAHNVVSDVRASHAQKKAPPARPSHQITEQDLIEFGTSRADYTLLDEILRSSWFGRSWINQEIGYAYTADFYIGKYRMRWDALRRLAIVLEDLNSEKPSEQVQLASGLLRIATIKNLLERNPDGKLAPLEAMNLCRPCDAGDPRDKVYSVLSMMRGGDRFKVDYTASWQTVFEDFARHVITTERRLSILSCCNCRQDREMDLPSWVPDWTDREIVRQPLNSGFRASGNFSPQVTFPSRAKLATKAMLFDRILEASVALAPSSKYSSVNQFNHHHVDNEKQEAQVSEVFFAEAERIAAQASDQEAYSLPRDVFLRTLVGDRNIHGPGVQGASSHLEQSAIGSHWYTKHGNGLFHKIPAPVPPDQEIETLAQEYDRTARKTCADSRFFSTHRGFFGLGPRALQSNDIIAVLRGADVPYVLRERDAGGYQLVGFCYVDGIMKGEIFGFAGDLDPVDICIE